MANSLSGSEGGAVEPTFSNALVLVFSHEHTPRALRDVLEVVGPVGNVSVLAVVPTPSTLQRLLTPHETTAHVERILREDIDRELRDWVAKAVRGTARAASSVPVEVVAGHPVATALHHVLDDHCDLLVVTTTADDPTSSAIAKRLQRKSPCPVWAIRPSRARTRRVMAAVDTDPEHHGLDRRILAAAASIARPGDELHVATAWELVGESTLRASPFVGEGDLTVDSLREQCELDHRATLEELVAQARVATDDVHLEVVNGAPAATIAALVARHRINHLVMGTIGRTGIPGFVVGNTAEQVLTEVPCSVLVVKPPGFVSPVHR